MQALKDMDDGDSQFYAEIEKEQNQREKRDDGIAPLSPNSRDKSNATNAQNNILI